MARRRKRKKGSRKMPDHVLAHFAAKTIIALKKRGIVPELNAHKKRR
jgi:hypothetical protein